MLKNKEKDFDGYFEDLAEGTKTIVKDLIEKHFEDNCEVFYQTTEELECKRRDGFIPHSFNRGGMEVNGFTDLMSIHGSGTMPSHAKARAEIERQIDQGFKSCAEHCFEKFKDLAEKHELKEEDFNHYTIHEIAQTHEEFEEVERYIEDSEMEFLGISDSSIMYSIRFMYHGIVDGKHSASVSAAVNTEGPYHRSRISWAPEVFCEGAKEVEIEWGNQTQLKDKLDKALKKVCKEVL